MLDRIDVKYFKLAVGLDRIGKESQIDISARCPVCGDSRTKRNSARLHLYYKEGTDVGLVNCFNSGCSAENKSIFSFLKDFYPALFDQFKREKFISDVRNLQDTRTDVFDFSEDSAEPVDLDQDLDWMDNIDLIEESPKKPKSRVQILDLSSYFVPIKQSREALLYIKSRGFGSEVLDNYGEWYFCEKDLKIDGVYYRTGNSLVIPLYNEENKMYGFYSRNISNKTFATFMQDVNIGFKVWNWFNIDKSKPVYIFEGIFDALASGLPNVIATMGAKMPDDRIRELKNPVFCLDNDCTGLKNARDYAKLGYNVYIQPDEYTEKDMNDLMKSLNNINKNISSIILENIYSGPVAIIKINAKL